MACRRAIGLGMGQVAHIVLLLCEFFLLLIIGYPHIIRSSKHHVLALASALFSIPHASIFFAHNCWHLAFHTNLSLLVIVHINLTYLVCSLCHAP